MVNDKWYCFLLQPRHPAEQIHEFGTLRTVQLSTDTVGHVEPPLVSVFVGDDQMEGLHHQLFVFVQRPSEVFVSFHAYQGHDRLLFRGRQRAEQPQGVGDEGCVDHQRIICLTVVGGDPAVERRQVLLQVCQVVYLNHFTHGVKGIDKREFFQVYH